MLFDPRLADLMALHIAACNAPEGSKEERSAVRRRNALAREIGPEAVYDAKVLGNAVSRMSGIPSDSPWVSDLATYHGQPLRAA